MIKYSTNKERGAKYCERCGSKIDEANYRRGHEPLCWKCRVKDLDDFYKAIELIENKFKKKKKNAKTKERKKKKI